jgi:hypothetical protein
MALRRQQYFSKSNLTSTKSSSNLPCKCFQQRSSSTLFDNSSTKPLWRYFADRHADDTVFNIFDQTNNFVAFIKANVGINQGDTASLLLFDIFVSDCHRSIDNATDFQIHDDIYAACEPKDADATLQQLTNYVEKKGLTMNAAKTQILKKTFPHTFATLPNRQQSKWEAFTSNRSQHHSA